MRKRDNYNFWNRRFLRNLLLGLMMGFLFMGCVKKADQKTLVGVIVTENMQGSSEIIAMKTFLEQFETIEFQFIQVDENEAESQTFPELDVLWLHHRNSNTLSGSFSGAGFSGKLNTYIENSGKLLLTMDGLQLLPALGLEQQAPDTLTVEAFDRGYGRQLGFHAFLEHPLFERLNGGAYIFNPETDTATLQTGYFDPDFIPQGKVIAVDWSYITFHEEKKLILEYNKGVGRVLAIGAYLDFSIENKNREEFALFIQNVVQYLHDPIPEKVNYWNYNYGEVTKFEPDLPNIEIPLPQKWELRQNELSYNIEAASEDFWDLTGERMVVMGKENSGIDEIWAHPFMALRDYEVAILENKSGQVIQLKDLTPSIEISPERIMRTYELNDGMLKEIITVHHENPVAAIQYQWEGAPAELIVQFKSNLRLMWPYSHKVLGQVKYGWGIGGQTFIATDERKLFTTMIGFNQKPKRRLAGQFDGFIINNGELLPVETGLSQVNAVVSFDLSENQMIDFIISASDYKDPNLITYHSEALQNPHSVYQNSSAYYANLLKNKLMITTPDENLNRGYRWALIGTERHFASTPGIGSSLLAGIGTTARGWNGRHEINGRPGYAWYFGRDGQWSGFAINGYGDFEKVRDILALFIKYQALNGKIFHELTTSGAVHYDAADATPLFVVMMGKYLRASGDLEFIQKNRESIQKAVDFCYSTDTDGDGLIENTNVGHGWVEGGFLFGGKTTIYLASCWAAALQEAGYIAAALKENKLSKQYLADSEKVKAIVNNHFFNDSLGFYNHSLNPDNTFIEENTIMSAIPIYFGHIDPRRADASLDNWASNNFTANWGVRIVGEDNPRFHPTGYHSGSVWPLYTGWVALAEYKNGRPAQGFSHVKSTISIKDHWAKGFVEEVMHGAEFTPRGVCAHQCWSETMIILPLIEGLTGYEPDALHQTLHISPAVPADWDFYELNNIPVHEKSVSLKMQRSKEVILWYFQYTGFSALTVNFQPRLPAGTKISTVKIDGKPIDFRLKEGDDIVISEVSFEMIRSLQLEVFYTDGIALLPLTHNPVPGSGSAGLRIIRSELKGQQYVIGIEAPPGTSAEIEVYVHSASIRDVVNARLLRFEGNIAKIAVQFSGTAKYIRKDVTIQM